MGTLLEIIHYGEPVPAMRPRVTQRGTYTPEPYASYKKRLAAAIRQEYGHWAWDIPGTDKPKERTKYLKTHKYALFVYVTRSKARGDADNFLKASMDSLQDAGVIANDSQIEEASVRVFTDKEDPRIKIRMHRIDEAWECAKAIGEMLADEKRGPAQ